MLFDNVNNIQAYLNGSPVTLSKSVNGGNSSTVSAVNLLTTTNQFNIGTSSDSTNNFQGVISKFAIYNKVLTPTEITNIYNNSWN